MPIAEWQIDVKADRHRCIDRTAAFGRELSVNNLNGLHRATD